MDETKSEKRESEGGLKTPPAPTTAFQVTPLVFSPSPVASLGSSDRDDSLHEVYSSHEASRGTSGRLSPSDLPDSPSQTMPTSPPPGEGPRVPSKPGIRSKLPPLAPTRQNAMYADAVRRFQDEGTPVVFSTGIPLSGFEDDPDSAKSSSTTMSEDSDMLLGQLITSAMPRPAKTKVDLDNSNESSCSENEQDLLADCIASAMPVAATRLSPTEKKVASLESKQFKKEKRHQSLLFYKVPSAPPEFRCSSQEYRTEGDNGDVAQQSKLSFACVSPLGSFQSHLPRPSTIGRSSSSGSSEPSDQGAAGGRIFEPNKSSTSSLSELSTESLDKMEEEEEDMLLAACISSAMPKISSAMPMTKFGRKESAMLLTREEEPNDSKDAEEEELQ